ncbi:MAG: S1C family serine protease [Planctomycetaceae bacterium]
MDTTRINARSRCAVAIIALTACMRPVAAEAPPTAVAARRDLADRVLACTVAIASKADAYSRNSGTGIVVSPDGHVLTATSVVPIGAKEVKVTFPGFERRDAVIVAADEKLAVTLLKVEARDLPFLRLARGIPEVGATVYTAGDVEDAMLTSGRASFSRGIVSGVYDVPACPEADYAGVAIETTAAVNPGSDGGPLVDATGAVCGVITLGVLPLRWQGTAVPTQVLLERFAPFTSGGIVTPAGPSAASGASALQAAAAPFARLLVGIEVERKFPPEALPRTSWTDFRKGLEGFDALSHKEQEKRFSEWLAVSKVLEVNQLLRRPAAPVTGVVVSPDGHVLTSLFNVGGDTAFVNKATGKPRTWDVHAPIQKLLGGDDKGVEQRSNSVEKVTVILPDGARKEAKVVARHVPLGVALLKVDAAGLPCLDLADVAVSPQLGDEVGVLGRLDGGRPGWTLGAGIVSAPARNRGFQFQTDALLNYGNSGGPVFDRAGNLLGIAAAPLEPDTILGRLVSQQQLMSWTRAPNSGVGLVARADRIRDALEALKSGKSFDRIPGPFLGIEADQGKAFTAAVVVGRVAAQSPAERAGLKAGDVLLEFNGVELRSWPDLTDRIAACGPGDAVELKVQRKGGGPRLVINGRDIETAADFEKFKKSLEPGDTFEGTLSSDDTRTLSVELGENK